MAYHDFTARLRDVAADMEIIESLVDRLGMTEIMLLLTHICGEKAEHIREIGQRWPHDWQDEELAKRWDIVADALISKRLSNALNKLSE